MLLAAMLFSNSMKGINAATCIAIADTEILIDTEVFQHLAVTYAVLAKMPLQ
jgi:hypothetical protein